MIKQLRKILASPFVLLMFLSLKISLFIMGAENFMEFNMEMIKEKKQCACDHCKKKFEQLEEILK